MCGEVTVYLRLLSFWKRTAFLLSLSVEFSLVLMSLFEVSGGRTRRSEFSEGPRGGRVWLGAPVLGLLAETSFLGSRCLERQGCVSRRVWRT